MITAAGLAGAALAFFLGHDGTTRVGVWLGALSATVSGLIAYPFLLRGASGPPNRLLRSLVLGMLCRFTLVAGGLFAANALRGDLIAFTVAFFSLYLLQQALEFAFVARDRRARDARPAEDPQP